MSILFRTMMDMEKDAYFIEITSMEVDDDHNGNLAYSRMKRISRAAVLGNGDLILYPFSDELARASGFEINFIKTSSLFYANLRPISPTLLKRDRFEEFRLLPYINYRNPPVSV